MGVAAREISHTANRIGIVRMDCPSQKRSGVARYGAATRYYDDCRPDCGEGFFRLANLVFLAALRYSLGERPNRLRNSELNEPRLSKPTEKQTCVTGKSVPSSKRRAASKRHVCTNCMGVWPNVALNW